MNDPFDENEEMLWQNLVKAFLRYVEASSAFLAPGVDRVKLLRQGFGRGDIVAALTFATRLESSELIELLPELVKMSTAHAHARKAREIILSLPHDRLITSIEEVAEPILQSDDEFAPLEPTEASEKKNCNDCQACIRACPAKALALPQDDSPYAINKFACRTYRQTGLTCSMCMKACAAAHA